MVIGETVKRLSDSFRTEHPEIPWSEIAGMRDKLIHEYDNVDTNMVWEALEQDVPILLEFARSILFQEE